MNNKKWHLSIFFAIGDFFKRLILQIQKSIRIQLLLAFSFCIAVSLLVGFLTTPLFLDKERSLDFTEGIVTIDESARNLSKQFAQMNHDVNGLVNELGSKDPSFRKLFLNRPLHSVKHNKEMLSIPGVGGSFYHLTKKELIQYLINTPNKTSHFKILITDLDGEVQYKSKGLSTSTVDIEHVIEDSNYALIGKNHNEHPTFTRFYPITINGTKGYLIVSATPKATVVYVKEPGFIPYILGFITFFICFYFITKRKMKEMKEIALGLKEIAKGKLDYRINEKSKDELGSLASNINYMALELQQIIEKDRQTEKLKDELITNISHDLRTPLTSVMGYLRLVKDHQYEQQAQLDEYVNVAYGKSEQLKKLIEDLFDFTMLNYEGINLNTEKININQMLKQLIVELDPIAEENNVSFNKNLPNEKILIKVDPNKMVRALENILSNAIKYSTKSGIIQVDMIKMKNSIQIMVLNQCEPFTEEEIRRLFDRFYRVDSSRSSSKVGAGLGLAIAKNIIELHKGRIDAKYHNRVICLTITLPFQ